MGGRHQLNPLKRTNSLQNLNQVDGDSYNFYMFHVKKDKGNATTAAKNKKKVVLGTEQGEQLELQTKEELFSQKLAARQLARKDSLWGGKKRKNSLRDGEMNADKLTVITGQKPLSAKEE